MAIIYALLSTVVTWGATALGAASVFFVNRINDRLLATTMGFAGGVMTAAGFFSLLLPALGYAEELGAVPWITVLVGFSVGTVFLYITDKMVERNEKNVKLLMISMTAHNIPEGLVVGIAFAVAGVNGEYLPAVIVGLGIAIQNIPEGMAIALPMRLSGKSKMRSFFFGQLSASVEIVAGVIGALLVSVVRWILPYALAFAAGAMMWVVVAELVPESVKAGRYRAIIGYLFGFAVMMVLDVALG